MTTMEATRRDRRLLEHETPLRRIAVIRIVVVLAAAAGLNYVVWRWLFSVNWDSWWIGLPLILAETYSLIDSLLFGLAAWRIRERGEPPSPPAAGYTVDVFITTYNEPVELVMRTAREAIAISYPHTTWILDDGARDEIREAANALGIEVITRSADWVNMPRHAKAGNLNNALLATEGEFILILDADQVPDRRILDRTLGYFKDPGVALVQTPQWFENVAKADVLGSQAPLFYGPIQQSKDGWNAAFFCGSNAILRREALMQLGLSRYVADVERSVYRALRTAQRLLVRARAEARGDRRVTLAVRRATAIVDAARAELAQGDGIADVTYRFQRGIDAIVAEYADSEIALMRDNLREIAAMSGEPDEFAGLDDAALELLSDRATSPVAAIEAIAVLASALNVDRGDEAQAIMPMATISVTEDMATSMRLHALGWRSVFHSEILASGLAPDDLETMLGQRLRWAQGTMQVFFRENPLFQRQISLGQRLMYFGTMWSYLSGFPAVVYVAAPVLCLSFGVIPVVAFSAEFFARFIPFFLINQLLFIVVAAGRPTWRGQQYSLALFPVWIEAVTSAFRNVFLGEPLGFRVTSKTGPADDRPRWDLVKPQLFVMAALVVSLMVVGIRIAVGQAEGIAPYVNILWVFYDLAVFSIIIRAVLYRAPAVLGKESP